MSTIMISELQARKNTNGAARRRRVPHFLAPCADSEVPTPESTILNPRAKYEAVLQGGVGKRADKMTVACSGSAFEIGLSAQGEPVLAGSLENTLEIGGALVASRGDWQAVCSHVDADGEYLELQLLLDGTVTIDRQLFMSRSGRFALLADTVVIPAAAKIDYRLVLPTAGIAAMKFSSATRECRVRAARLVARAFPLALPQDRVLSAAGSFLARDGNLELSQSGSGRALYVPVVFDWHPKRCAAAVEWRSLTVTEAGRTVGPDRAAGHRLRLGKHQLLIYRNLDGSREARAVLGHHTRYESVVGRFDAKGNVAPLVLVEAD